MRLAGASAQRVAGVLTLMVLCSALDAGVARDAVHPRQDPRQVQLVRTAFLLDGLLTLPRPLRQRARARATARTVA